MAGTLKNLDCHPIKIGGVFRFNRPPERRLIKAPPGKRPFRFQLAEWIRRFLGEPSNLESVTAYILNQAEHHKKFSYQEEIRQIMKRHRVAFNERYIWD
jgi:hypothetical protein